jgi:hypothetical protein
MVTTNDINQQNKRAEMVRERDALNGYIARGGVGAENIATARAESQRLTTALGKMPPNAGRAFRRASRVRASRVKPSYPLPVVRAVETTHGKGEQARRRRQIAAGVIRVTG